MHKDSFNKCFQLPQASEYVTQVYIERFWRPLKTKLNALFCDLPKYESVMENSGNNIAWNYFLLCDDELHS